MIPRGTTGISILVFRLSRRGSHPLAVLAFFVMLANVLLAPVILVLSVLASRD